MNKNVTTNLMALALVLLGGGLQQPILLNVGLFALAGAVTNTLAIHMLFEKVPLLYGSGVIPLRFNEFKAGIQHLVMNQFFNQHNIERFLADKNTQQAFDFGPIIEQTDLSPAFSSLLKVVEQSSFGGMLAMFGGTSVLLPLQEPFIAKLKLSLVEITQTEDFHHLVQTQLADAGQIQQLSAQVEHIVQQRLDELTPGLVKEMIQQMIREHLGWLVVWGGVFGALLGLLAAFLPL
ncbi:hypothetical protein GCM10010919_32870 [Alishewanella longhuensis]|uniref:DUF445 domain-containing protein n=1 Tax=Alishewanella longhuensis TaxID=1091037 RepID=A0ABQ3L223_9ALTE|nr:DUF445 domain-containing protein [Alishewanella longhuensis]GHG77323.1 hypothetical protein GCM10010919_32870 [Alishewanella longhuensis]